MDGVISMNLFKKKNTETNSNELANIYHKNCGGLIGYVNNVKSSKKMASNFILLNGKHPNPGDALDILCTKCGAVVTNFEYLSTHEFVYDHWE